MEAIISTVDDKGRIYIPSDIRLRLGIKPGDKVRIQVMEDKLVITVEKRVKMLRRGEKWGSEAFLDAGEALVSG